MNAFIIAAPRSGGGKTTISLLLMRALGERVVPFKVGPDYIDPMFHKESTGSASNNLDIYMCGEEGVKKIFNNSLESDSIAVVEGVMGLFDGISEESGYSSTAHVSQVLGIPVILILDGRGQSTSIAATVKGFSEFEILGKRTPLAGVILNRIKSEPTYELLKREIEKNTDIPVLGYFPEKSSIVLNSRHLGLVPPDEIDMDTVFDEGVRAVEENIDLEKLLSLTEYEPETCVLDVESKRYCGLRIAYALDKAFNFYYEENLKTLENLGVELIPFSPLTDKNLPENIDALYIGGGFPEVFFEELEGNTLLKEEILERLNGGLYCYAECGGLIYLSDIIHYGDSTYRGVGFFKNEIMMQDRLQNFGYCELEIRTGDTVKKVLAHEFHHTKEIKRENLPYAYTVKQRGKYRKGGMIKKNTVAGCPHIHFCALEDGREVLYEFLDRVRDKSD